MELLNIENETFEQFQGIASRLLNEYAIETYDSKYRITELEFYWNSPAHKDKVTYVRNHIDPKSGDWFFHYSGVDIALKDDSKQGYGGILLRSIYDMGDPDNVSKRRLYKGPMICAMRLFSGTNAFSESIKTRIVPFEHPPEIISKSLRIGMNENDPFKYEYRFFIPPIVK